MTAPTPRRCLAAADQMLRGAGPLGAAAVSGGWWPRACACLIRLALEDGIDAYWRRTRPVVAACRQGRAKQLMLRGRFGPGLAVARRVAFTWAALSAAAHHHCYELAPTAAELRRLHTEVSALLTHLDGRTEPAPMTYPQPGFDPTRPQPPLPAVLGPYPPVSAAAGAYATVLAMPYGAAGTRRAGSGSPCSPS